MLSPGGGVPLALSMRRPVMEVSDEQTCSFLGAQPCLWGLPSSPQPRHKDCDHSTEPGNLRPPAQVDPARASSCCQRWDAGVVFPSEAPAVAASPSCGPVAPQDLFCCLPKAHMSPPCIGGHFIRHPKKPLNVIPVCFTRLSDAT